MQNKELAAKPRFEILDGLRGIAALIVVAYHLLEVFYGGDSTKHTINHGYLAVDFFFVLSGFVIGYAYDDRWGRMSVWKFFRRRLVRLHPSVIMGTVIGALLFWFGTCDAYYMIMDAPWWKYLLIIVSGLLMIPAPVSMDIRGWSETYPLNGPAWSLMFEYIANILYALIFRHLSKTVLGILVALSALITVDIAMNINMFGLIPEYHAEYTMIGGWSLTSGELYIGFGRLFFPFLAGLLIFRTGKSIKVMNGFPWCSLMIAAILAVPCLGTGDTGWINGLYQVIAIVLLFPLIVMMGAGSRVTGRKATAVCNFLGEISYPLYITHFPLACMHYAWIRNHLDAPVWMQAVITIAVFILAIGMAYACLKLYDRPVRKWLSGLSGKGKTEFPTYASDDTDGKH